MKLVWKDVSTEKVKIWLFCRKVKSFFYNLLQFLYFHFSLQFPESKEMPTNTHRQTMFGAIVAPIDSFQTGPLVVSSSRSDIQPVNLFISPPLRTHIYIYIFVDIVMLALLSCMMYNLCHVSSPSPCGLYWRFSSQPIIDRLVELFMV